MVEFSDAAVELIRYYTTMIFIGMGIIIVLGALYTMLFWRDK